ncbi:MAG TPA: DUF4058 family protein [Isosphaeraceae bacterium]|nr:DUF4058 family protein [Isosphaeraceae bacterium]
MPSPFPGMDPYLEQPSGWTDVHVELISATRAALKALVGPKYLVRIEERIYISNDNDPGRIDLVPDVQVSSRDVGARPLTMAADGGTEVAEPLVLETLVDEKIREAYIKVVDAQRNKVVTVIEILSPDNKVAKSQGLKSFRMKRVEVMRSASHWVEIDLLRRGVSLPLRKRIRPHDYFVHVSPTHRRPLGLVWPIRLSQRLPVIPIPLRAGDDDAPLDLQSVLDTAYDHAGYDTDINYTKEPVPPLSPPWSEWSDRWLREKGLRPQEAIE